MTGETYIRTTASLPGRVTGTTTLPDCCACNGTGVSRQYWQWGQLYLGMSEQRCWLCNGSGVARVAIAKDSNRA